MVAEALPKPASIWSRRRLQEVWRHSSRKRRLLKGQWALGARAPAGSRERGPRHPQQVETEAQAQAREKLDRHLQRSQRARARAKEREERTKERATQSTKPGCSFFYSWNFGSGARGELPPGSSCPAGRAHKCTTCRSDKHPRFLFA